MSDDEKITLYNELRKVVELDADDAEAVEMLESLATILNESANSVKVTPSVSVTTGPDGVQRHYTPGRVAYELLWDRVETSKGVMQEYWYSCVVLQVIPPTSSIGRTTIKVGVLGYPNVENVTSEHLRTWEPATTPITSNLSCHAVHPTLRMYRPCTVDRITPQGDAVVSFLGEGPATHEVPATHIRTTGKVFATLVKKKAETEAEAQQRKEENAARKKARKEMVKQVRSDILEQDSADWQGLLEFAAPVSKGARKER